MWKRCNRRSRSNCCANWWIIRAPLSPLKTNIAQEYITIDKVGGVMHDRDVNDVRSDDIVHWACATREILARVTEGLDVAMIKPTLPVISSET